MLLNDNSDMIADPGKDAVVVQRPWFISQSSITPEILTSIQGLMSDTTSYLAEVLDFEP